VELLLAVLDLRPCIGASVQAALRQFPMQMAAAPTPLKFKRPATHSPVVIYVSFILTDKEHE